ncbi:MAG: hypothetical protein IPG39_06615 [Bacteroidetes bacterium]|nr:hypothetical protein [Bacteroidota bacterium]
MVDLLIAILISLGCNATSEATPEELRDAYGTRYDRAVEIYNNGEFAGDGGGVVILETGGD